MSHSTDVGPPGNKTKTLRTTVEPTSQVVVNALYATAIGVDVHHSLLVCAHQYIDFEKKEIVTEQAEFGCSFSEIEAFAQWCWDRQPDVVLMESTGVLWRSPYEKLEEVGFGKDRLALVNARDVKAVCGRKTDSQDAQRLAEYARLGRFKKSFVPTKVFRDMRAVARAYRKAKDDLSRHMNRYQKDLNAAGCRATTAFSSVKGKSARIILEACICGAPDLLKIIRANCGRLKASASKIHDALRFNITGHIRALLQNERRHLLTLEKRCAELMALLANMQEPWQPLVELLMTLTGVKETAARLILAETSDDLSTFPGSECFASWCGLCPGNNKSAGKEHGSRTPKGNAYIRKLLVECAHAVALSRKGGLYLRHKAFRARMSAKKSIVATAHLLCRIIFAIIKRKVPYCPRPTSACRDAYARKLARAAEDARRAGIAVQGDSIYDKATGEVLSAFTAR